MANWSETRRCFTERVIPYSYLSTIPSTARLTQDVSTSSVVQLTLTTVVQTDSNQQNRFAITFNGFVTHFHGYKQQNLIVYHNCTTILKILKITSNFHKEFVITIQNLFQMNVVTHFLDLSIVYGSNDQVAANLRAGVNGRLRVDVRTNREWPPSAPNASESCDIVSPVEVCYLAGKI